MKLQKGFSLVELFIVIVIIGFIVIAELIILNKKINQYDTPYYTIYNTLRKSSYAILADEYCPGTSCPVAGLQAPRAFPNTSKDLCDRLAEYLNTTENNCNLLEDSSNLIDAEASGFPQNPHLRLSNSYKLYFGDLTTATEIPNTHGMMKNLDYFLVYADINGDKNPNRITCDNSNDMMPDIVPFAVTRTGEVIPLGLPVYSKIYATAKVYWKQPVAGTTQMNDVKTGTMNLFEAFHTAWGEKNAAETSIIGIEENFDIPLSILLTTRENSGIANNSNIKSCITDDMNNLSVIDVNSMCAGGTYSCRVTFDKSIETRF